MDVFYLADPRVLVVGKLFFVLVCLGSLVAMWRLFLVSFSATRFATVAGMYTALCAVVGLTIVVGLLAVRELYQALVICCGGLPWIQ